MMNKKDILQAILDKKIVAIFRGIDPGKCSCAANALYDGGIGLCEVTFQRTEKEQGYPTTLQGIRNIIAGADGRNLLVGAGTVLTTEQVTLAWSAGARFIITPTINTEVIRLANELGMVTMPGAFTPTELETAYEAGADLVKVFPASDLGPGYFKSVRGPLGHIPLVAVGGVNLENAKAFLDAGAVGLGIGGNLVSKKLMDAGRYEELTELAKQYAQLI